MSLFQSTFIDLQIGRSETLKEEWKNLFLRIMKDSLIQRRQAHVAITKLGLLASTDHLIENFLPPSINKWIYDVELMYFAMEVLIWALYLALKEIVLPT